MFKEWSEFFFLCGSSAAGLTGLMFISVTFGFRLITKENMAMVNVFLSGFAYHFLHVFLICCVASAPTVTAAFLGLTVVLTAVYRLSHIPSAMQVIKRHENQSELEIDRSDRLLTLYSPAAIYLLMLVAGVLMVMEWPHAVELLAASLILMLFLGVRGSWDMIVWTATRIDN